jgi:hypothetical protein
LPLVIRKGVRSTAGACAVLCVMFAAGAGAAQGADPGPAPTTTTPTETLPTPDPAPAPRPAPRPKPKATPRATVYQPRRTTPPPAPVVRSQPTVRPAVTKQAPKRHVVHKKKHRKPRVQSAAPPAIPNVVASKGLESGVLGAQSTIIRTATDPFDLDALLVVAALSLAIMCFGIAAFPAGFVPWRPATRFVVSGRLPLIFVGLGVCGAAFLVARGSW